MQVTRIKQGRRRLPEWFIAGMCREIGAPVEVVMGQEWAQRHLPLTTAFDLPADTTDDGHDDTTAEAQRRAS